LPVTAWIVATLGLAGAAFFGWAQLSVFRPAPLHVREAAERSYDPAPMQRAVATDAVARRQRDLTALGSRFLGLPGNTAAGEFIRRTFAEAGLEILEHTVETPAPRTLVRALDLVDAAGGTQPSGVEIYPFLPNHLQPATTGTAGLRGRLVLLTPEVLRTRERFDDAIGVIDAAEGRHDPDFLFDWTKYARLGVRALVISHSGGFDRIPWHQVAIQKGGVVASVPVNFPRVAAEETIFRHIGREVNLRLVTRFEAVENTITYGILRAPQAAREALVIPVPYDAMSVLPDRSPGALQAVGAAFSLQVLEGLNASRAELKRDVVFVAYGSSFMAEDGLNHLARILQKNVKQEEENPLLRAFGIPTLPTENTRVQHLRKRVVENAAQAAPVAEVRAMTAASGFLSDVGATERALEGLGTEARQVFREQFAYVLNSLVLELSEPLLQTKVAFERAGERVDSPEFNAYLAAKKAYDRLQTYAGYQALNLLRDHATLLKTHAVADRLRARLDELEAHHRFHARRLDQEVALARLFDGYEDVAVFPNRLVPSWEPGADEAASLYIALGEESPRAASIYQVHAAIAERTADGTGALKLVQQTRARGGLSSQAEPLDIGGVGSVLDRWGYATYTLFNLDRQSAYRHYTSPSLLPEMFRIDSLRRTFAVSGEALLAMACGEGNFSPGTIQEWIYFSFGGQVLVSNVGQSIVPNYPLKRAVIANRSVEREELYSKMGYYSHPLVMTDAYGKFRLDFNSNDFPVWWRVAITGQEYSPLAAGYDDEGFIRFIKDEGDEGQRLFKSTKLNIRSGARENVSIVTFRAAPVALLDLTNPQTMKDYTATQLISADGLVEYGKGIRFQGLGLNVNYIEPDRSAYVLMQSGAPGNDLVQMTRGFMLGVEDPRTFEGEREIDGPGYLAADHPQLPLMALETARSMASVNRRRLELQERHHMADGQTLQYQTRTIGHLDQAEQPGLPLQQVIRHARDAVTYAMLNHPVIRNSVLEAVISILWYLALLVPFVFFFEKLVFCNADVRKQIAAQVVIFLVVFALLRVLHPAFAMVRSSVMILLGFVIILISGGITLIFSSKFKENLAELRKRQGKVEGAEVNTLGVLGSAFMLGLNNMHRRKVRTGLTCATLVLLTFVMISFTSVRNDLAIEDVAIGKAPYQGMLVKKEMFEPLSDAEVFAFQSKYSDRFDVCLRRFYRGMQDWRDGQRSNPGFSAVHQDATGAVRSADFDSALQLDAREPLREKLDFVGPRAWFDAGRMTGPSGLLAVLIPDTMAGVLGITPEAVGRGGAVVRINGRDCEVRGIFKAVSLETASDLDGLDLRPFDIKLLPEVVESGRSREILAKETDPRIPAGRMVIFPLGDLGLNVQGGVPVNSSVAISMPGVPYREAAEQTNAFMEQTAQPLFYGLDGVAYRGKRTRETSLEGLMDLLIPLIIAGLTVLNTMKGSVYERRDEIYVYNAVGIAPRYIFFMFIAEALVYAVVGSVLGYLLSQGVGRVLTELGWTGGLNMTYTSLSTIYASLTIMAAVFISTWFPARSAMEIAKPADDAGWSLPEPEGDTLAFDLPFTFRARERMAVLSFFDRYLLDHAEGSAGLFYAGTPHFALAEEAQGPVPSLVATVWLKPFDLAVSQSLGISLPVDPETGQFKARITLTRLSGTRESWLRLNHTFVGLVRRHFLHWRAVTPDECGELFREAKEKFEAQLQPQEAGV
jgi:hypothetical protein